MKLNICLLLLLMPVLPLLAEGQHDLIPESSWLDSLKKIETSAVVASRLLKHDKEIATGQYLSESTLIASHRYQSLMTSWRVNEQLYKQKNEGLSNHSEFELSELFYSFSLFADQGDFWRVGKFNQPIDPGYALHSVAFFESTNNPFDNFASNEGINMLSFSFWAQQYYINAIVALEGTTTATEDLQQWALILQRDFDALSTTLLVQQYQHAEMGLGATFTYVLGDAFEFHGSGFVRQGSVWQTKFFDAKWQRMDKSNDDKWRPRLVLGSNWTSQHLQFLVEWSYQAEKLTLNEIQQLQRYQPQSSAQAVEYQADITQLYQQRYQQQYLFAQTKYTREDHSLTANALIGEDLSALSQLKYEYLGKHNLSYWFAVDISSGAEQTEFSRIPWGNRTQIGLQWKI